MTSFREALEKSSVDTLNLEDSVIEKTLKSLDLSKYSIITQGERDIFAEDIVI